MEDFVETVTEAVIEGSGSGAPKYTAEEIGQQTTDFLLAFIDTLSDLTEEAKAKLRTNVIEQALNPDALNDDIFPKKSTASVTPQDLLKLIALIILVFVFLGFFGYKLYTSIMEKETKKDKKSKKELKKEKKLNSPPASPRSQTKKEK